VRGQQIGIKFGSTQVQTKSFKFLRKFTNGKSFKFLVCYIIHPKPKTYFCDHILVHNPIWVWSKILEGDSNIPQDYGISTYFSSHFPSLLCPRMSIIQAWGRRHYIISDKCYVSIMLQKVLRSKRKKWKLKKNYDEKKRKVRKKEEERKKKREKWEGNKIKVIKMLLGSFYFISSQVSWWQIHTQIFQPCAIR
jgi:hypothetical protein